MKIKYIVDSMRPKDWIKNLFVLSPLIYSQLLNEFDKIIICSLGFLSFSFISGCVYIINDIKDVDKDKYHPINRERPLAAGKINKSILIIVVSIISPLAILFSFILDSSFGLIIFIYFFINILYSFKLKNIIILDIIIISLGFVLRVLGGGILVNIYPSPWVIITTFCLAMFLGCSKRRTELELIQNKEMNKINQRETLNEYTIELIDKFLVIMASGSIISYAIYCASDYAYDKFQTYNLIYTTIFVINGIFRYYYLIMIRKTGLQVNNIILHDIPFIINIIAWICTTIIIIGI